MVGAESAGGGPQPPGRLFWRVLVVAPLLAACVCGTLLRSALVVPHAFLIACFVLASSQLFAFEWWRDNVEGDLGHPRLVHVGAGFAELIVIALRLYALSIGAGHGQGFVALAAAHVITCGLMGGALWTWLSLGLARCFASQSQHYNRERRFRPTVRLFKMVPTSGFEMCFAIVIPAPTGTILLPVLRAKNKSRNQNKKTSTAFSNFIYVLFAVPGVARTRGIAVGAASVKQCGPRRGHGLPRRQRGRGRHLALEHATPADAPLTTHSNRNGRMCFSWELWRCIHPGELWWAHWPEGHRNKQHAYRSDTPMFAKKNQKCQSQSIGAGSILGASERIPKEQTKKQRVASAASGYSTAVKQTGNERVIFNENKLITAVLCSRPTGPKNGRQIRRRYI